VLQQLPALCEWLVPADESPVRVDWPIIRDPLPLPVVHGVLV